VRVHLLGAGLALAIAVLAASPAAASPNSVTGLSWFLGLDGKLEAHLTANCTFPNALGWSYTGPPHAKQHGYGNMPPFADVAAGSYDPDTRRGSAVGKGPAIIFDPVFSSQGSGGHAFKLVNMGVQVTPKRVYLTGVIRRTRSQAAAARRQRLAVIARPHFSAGRRPDPLGKPYSSSYRFAVRGKAKITRALSAAFGRARCTSERFAGHSKGNGPIRPGTVLGNVTVGLLPATATGLAGHAYLQQPGFDLANTDDGTGVAVAPAAGAVVEKINRTRYLRFDLAPGTHAPLTCELGAGCVPAPGAALSLIGGMTLTYNGRSATVDGLVVTYGATTEPAVTGRLNGAPVTIDDGVGLTDDFASQVSAALGAPLEGDLAPVGTLFSTTTEVM
jgi:hypothetical protein